jgi:hypothetical protein
MQRTAAREHYHAPGAPITMAGLWDALCNRMSKAVCRGFHGEVSLPVSGKYYCLKCHREFDSGW